MSVVSVVSIVSAIMLTSAAALSPNQTIFISLMFQIGETAILNCTFPGKGTPIFPILILQYSIPPFRNGDTGVYMDKV